MKAFIRLLRDDGTTTLGSLTGTVSQEYKLRRSIIKQAKECSFRWNGFVQVDGYYDWGNRYRPEPDFRLKVHHDGTVVELPTK